MIDIRRGLVAIVFATGLILSIGSVDPTSAATAEDLDWDSKQAL